MINLTEVKFIKMYPEKINYTIKKLIRLIFRLVEILTE